jgi:predicted DNA-binding transcriptional regulator YafY
MKRQARLFALVEHLRGRRTGVTAASLAERFGTSVRTIYRDLDTLQDGALPLRAERGRGGGYALDRNYSLPPVNFNAREAAVLATVCRWAVEMRLMPFAETLQSGLDKVRGALSVSAQRDLVEHMAALQFVGIPSHAAPPKVREAVEQSWFERRPLKIRYRDSEGRTSERAVRIQGVVMERSLTLLTCEDMEKGEKRTFRLDRIEHAEVEPLSLARTPPGPSHSLRSGEGD